MARTATSRLTKGSALVVVMVVDLPLITKVPEVAARKLSPEKPETVLG